MRRGTARAVDRTVLLFSTLCLAGNSYHVPSRAFWDRVLGQRSYVLIVLLGLVTVFGALAPIEAWTLRSRIERSVTIRNQILSSFGRLLSISKGVRPPLPPSDPGLHVWKRRRTLVHPIIGILSRVATYRLGTAPVNRPFSPSKGVGVVGLCWKRNQEVGVDVQSLAMKLTSEEEYQVFREKNGGDAVMNLSWNDFDRLKHRGAVFASPIRNGRNGFIGCISVDASHGYQELDGEELRAQMSLLALVIGQSGFEAT
jgi:hypothetical protein